jgi:DNA polymerase-3 subunit gamma/tau
MSYLVLARKYRPRDFGALVGQPHVVQALANALTQQRLHHAYLFTGTRGVGKTTIARILAKSLNCTGPDGSGGITAQPCGVCDACRDIDSGRFVDYVELDAASNRGVDEITQLLDQAVYKPVLGRFKVYMIDEVHMLSNHAFNAMLKTLEEPPEYLKFVLATTDPQKVPPTVLSRCLQFNLRPMAPQTVQEHLLTVLAAEGIAAPAAALQLIARAARGSMRDALSLTDQAIAHGNGTIDEAGTREMLGAVDRGHAVRLVEALAARDGAAVIAAVDQLRELGLSAAGTLEELALLLQQMAVQQAVPQAGALDELEAATVSRLAPLLAADETQLLYSIALHGRAEIGLAPDEYSGLVMVLLRWLAFPGEGATVRRDDGENGSVKRVAAAAERPNAVRAAVPAPAAVARPVRPASGAAPEAPPGLTVQAPVAEARADAQGAPAAGAALRDRPRSTVAAADASAPAGSASAASPQGAGAPGDRWASAVQAMSAAGSIGALVRELAMQAECMAIDEQVTPTLWRLRVERETLRAAANCEKLQAALTGWLGGPVRLEVEPGAVEDSPARREAAERARRQAEAEQAIHDDPLVQALMAQYKTARIVPGSVKSL